MFRSHIIIAKTTLEVIQLRIFMFSYVLNNKKNVLDKQIGTINSRNKWNYFKSKK